MEQTLCNKQLIKDLAEKNDFFYNHIKACEELTELQERLLKRVMKDGREKQPSNESIIEEIGDVLIRVKILAEMYGKDKVKERIEYKLAKFASYVEQEKYKGAV